MTMRVKTRLNKFFCGTKCCSCLSVKHNIDCFTYFFLYKVCWRVNITERLRDKKKICRPIFFFLFSIILINKNDDDNMRWNLFYSAINEYVASALLLWLVYFFVCLYKKWILIKFLFMFHAILCAMCDLRFSAYLFLYLNVIRKGHRCYVITLMHSWKTESHITYIFQHTYSQEMDER